VVAVRDHERPLEIKTVQLQRKTGLFLKCSCVSRSRIILKTRPLTLEVVVIKRV